MSGRKIIFYGIFGILAAITFVVIVYLVTSNKSEISEIPQGLENYVLTQRFLNSPSCFVFQDEDTKRAYPSVIDLTKFTQYNIDNCYNARDTNVKAYRLMLKYGDNKIIIFTKNWQGFVKNAKTYHPFVYDAGKISTAELFMEIQDVK